MDEQRTSGKTKIKSEARKVKNGWQLRWNSSQGLEHRFESKKEAVDGCSVLLPLILSCCNLPAGLPAWGWSLELQVEDLIILCLSKSNYPEFHCLFPPFVFQQGLIIPIQFLYPHSFTDPYSHSITSFPSRNPSAYPLFFMAAFTHFCSCSPDHPQLEALQQLLNQEWCPPPLPEDTALLHPCSFPSTTPLPSPSEESRVGIQSPFFSSTAASWPCSPSPGLIFCH